MAERLESKIKDKEEKESKLKKAVLNGTSKVIWTLNGAIPIFLINTGIASRLTEYAGKFSHYINKFGIDEANAYVILGSISLMETIALKEIFYRFFKRRSERYYNGMNQQIHSNF